MTIRFRITNQEGSSQKDVLRVKLINDTLGTCERTDILRNQQFGDYTVHPGHSVRLEHGHRSSKERRKTHDIK